VFPVIRLPYRYGWALLLTFFLAGFQPVALAQFGFGVPLVNDFNWRIWKGTNDPLPASPDWRQPDYDDSGWSPARMPLSLDTAGMTRTPALRDMRGKYTTVFLRRTFVVADPAAYDSADLNGFVGGGCVAWLNGQPLVRTLVPPDPLALTDVALRPGDFEFGSFFASVDRSLLRAGTNVLTFRVLNLTLTSSDLFLFLNLTGNQDQEPPRLDRVLPEPDSIVTSLRQVELVFSEAVKGVEAADLVANGIAATNVTEAATGNYLFDFPPLPAGPLAVSLRPDHGITDRAGAPNALKTPEPWSYQLDPTARLEDLRITEFLGDNSRGIRDEDGDQTDWLEVRNFGRAPLSLAGWSLTTSAGGGARWVFPDRVMGVGEYLVIFASGKNRTNAAGILHTDFKLPKSGGSLRLFKPDGTEAGGFVNYPSLPEDTSYGLVPGVTGAAGYFVKPTPGFKNSEGGLGFAPEVEFSESSRTFTQTLGVALDTPEATAVIRYTTDQTEPTAQSPAYSGPLILSNATIIRARAFQTGLLPGPVHTESFFPLSPSLGAYTSTLPVVVINDFDGGRPPLGGRIPAYVQVFEPGSDGVTRLTDSPVLTSRAGIGTRGSSTSGNAKMNLRLEFRDEVDEDRKLSFAGLPADGDWVLYAPSNFDPALINNSFAHHLSREIGRYSPRTRYVEVYFQNVGVVPLDNRHYQGVYILEERIELGNDRVDVDRVAPGATQPPAVTGGYLFKIDRFGGDDGFVFTSRQQVLVLEPPGSELTSPQQNWLQQHFDAFETALYGPQFRDPVRGYRPYIDVPSWIDHHLLNVVLFNVDALRLSAYFHKPQNGPLAFGPVWDFDRALRSTDGRDFNPRVWRSTSQDRGTDFFNYTWWDQLFKDVDFYQEYIDRYEQLRRRQFSVTALHRLVDLEVAQVVEAQPREARRWGSRARGGYAREISDLKAWLSNRVAFIDGQFVRPPGPFVADTTRRLVQLNYTPPVGTTVYYTLDGSDPRARGGGVAARALVWDGTLAVPTNALLTARAFKSTHAAFTGPNNPPLKSLWSGVVREPVGGRPPTVALTEIHFHPAPAFGVEEEEDLEFLEVLNTGSELFDFAGFRVSGGVDFVCPTNELVRVPAGERLVIARDPQLLKARNPGLTRVVGPYTGRLSNDGDHLVLEGRYGEPVVELEFGDRWVPEADGDGYSLVSRYEGVAATGLTTAGGWRRSAFRGGSPGELDFGSVPDFQLGVTPTASGVKLGFRGALGRSHTVWARDDLQPGTEWQRLGTVNAGPAPRRLEFTDESGIAPRYYQVTTP
jgi:hypothetical protein